MTAVHQVSEKSTGTIGKMSGLLSSATIAETMVIIQLSVVVTDQYIDWVCGVDKTARII
jgi:hypothetical protein